MFTDNINTTVTELTIDTQDRALVALDFSDPLIRLEPENISLEEKICIQSRMIEGITEAKDHSGCLISFTEEEYDRQSLPGSAPSTVTVWLNYDSETPVACRTFNDTGAELPMDSYSCRANTILIEDDGWIFRVML